MSGTTVNTTIHRALRATLGAHHTSSKRQKRRNSLVVRVKTLFTAPVLELVRDDSKEREAPRKQGG